MKIIVYSKDECDFCNKARDLLRSKGMQYVEQKLGKDFSGDAIKKIFPDAKTYPVVTINGDFIGGFQELDKLLSMIR